MPLVARWLGLGLRDHLNSTINSWLLGGVSDHPIICGVSDHRNVCQVLAKGIDGDNLEISYTGPDVRLSEFAA